MTCFTLSVSYVQENLESTPKMSKKNGGAQEALWKAGRDRVRQVFFSYEKSRKNFRFSFLGRKNSLRLWLQLPNVDNANRRQKMRQMAKLALHVIRVQKGIVDYRFLQTNWTKS